MIDNLPDWDLSACNVYCLDGYVARDVDSIQISVVGKDGVILFDSESRVGLDLGTMRICSH